MKKTLKGLQTYGDEVLTPITDSDLEKMGLKSWEEETPKQEEKPEMIDRKEVSKILGVSLTQVERFRKQGVLPYYKLAHKCVRYSRNDCFKLLQSRYVKGCNQ